MRLVVTMQVDLPSDDLWKKPGRIARLFGAAPYRTGKERVVGSTLAVLDAVVEAHRAAGVTNVIAATIDDYIFFQDTDLVDDDLAELTAALEDNRRYLDMTFKRITLDMEHDDERLHTVYGTRIRGQVARGEKEIEVTLAARIGDLVPEEEESAVAFAARVRQLLAGEGFVAGHLDHLEGLANGLLDELELSTASEDVSIGRPEAGLFRASRSQMTALAATPFAEQSVEFFGEDPLRGSAGFSHDVYSRYYDNPFDRVIDLVAIDMARAGEAAGLPAGTLVHDYDGRRLGTVAELPGLDDPALEEARQLVAEEVLVALDEGRQLPPRR